MSTMLKILLIGSQGQVGQELQHCLPALGHLIALDRTQLDLTQAQQIHQQIEQHQPHIIVNAAAYTAVDRAEADAGLAKKVNTQAPTLIAEAAAALGSTLIHLSTDYVFGGQQGWPYTETDAVNPQSVYGHTKYLGEEGIRQACDRYFILRTAWVYGVYGKGNFVKTMLRLGAGARGITRCFRSDW